MLLLSWLSKFKKTPLVAENESSLPVGCDAPSTSKRPPTDPCSVLRSVDTLSEIISAYGSDFKSADALETQLLLLRSAINGDQLTNL